MSETSLRELRLRLDGRAVRLWSAGEESGVPILLLHGGGVDNARLSWRRVLPALARTRRVLAPDWPGYGGSQGWDRPHGIPDLVEWLVRLLDELGLDRSDVVGVSMGGAASLGLTLDHASRVRKLVPVSAYGLQPRAPALALSLLPALAPSATGLAYKAMRASRSLTRSMLRSIFADPQRVCEPLVDEVWACVREPGAGRSFRHFLRSELTWRGLRTHLMERLGEISAPVLLVHGRHDPLVPLAGAENAARRMPHARLRVMEAGHWPMRELPEDFNHLVGDFLGEDQH